jgi:uncharacterized membrane protein
MKQIVAAAILLLCLPLSFASAQEVYEELKEIVTAEVTHVLKEEVRQIEGTDTVTHVQNIEAKITSGTQTGRVVIFENELVELEAGDIVYLNYVKTINGDEYFIFKDFKRQFHLIALTLVFAGLLIFFARMQGVRALLSLGLSIAAILFVLVPALLSGYNAALVSTAIAGVILALVLFLTHGINPRSVIAFLGTFSAVLVTCLIAWFWVDAMKLTGFGSDASVYLNFSTNGRLDFAGLLLGSIIIGILGVLDDVSITQASVVQELKHASATLNSRELYMRAIKVGKDHIGSLVNTLALAYIGVSLPLVLLFATADASLALTLNQEVVAAELVRIIVGSIGLVLAIPMTTLVAAWWYGRHDVDEQEIESHSHSHTH